MTKAAVSCCELGVSFTREQKAPFDQEPRASGVWAQEGLRLHSRRVCVGSRAQAGRRALPLLCPRTFGRAQNRAGAGAKPGCQ